MRKVLMAFFLVTISSTSFATKYFVGAATANITPKLEMRPEVCMGGYGSPFQKCGLVDVSNRLTARSIAISDKDTTAVFTSIDVPGLSKSVLSSIKDEAQQRTGLAPSDLFISATHTHAGSDLLGVWGGVSTEYKEFVVKRVVRSINRALKFQEPAKIFTSVTNVAVENRRGWDQVDSSVNVLNFVSKYSKETIATLVNMSAHPTILASDNIEYSAGYVHYLRKTIENEIGGTTVFINGIVGDAQPHTDDQRNITSEKEYGRNVGKAVLNTIENKTKVRGDFEIKTAKFSHSVTNPLILGGIAGGLIDLDLDSENKVTTQVSYFRFGKTVEGVTFPGEALTRLGLPIKDTLTADAKFFFGLTNDSLGYFIPSDEFLQIEGRTTEESASLDPLIGTKAQMVLIELIEE